MKMFDDKGVEPRYYLNKVLKRKNGNLHCSNDKVVIQDDEESTFFDIKVIIDE